MLPIDPSSNAMLPLDPSDIVLIIDLALAILLAGYFALGHPRSWHRDPLGWVIFGYAVATVALLALIAYGIVFDQRVHEVARFIVAITLAGALIAKIHALYTERRAGRTDRKLSSTDRKERSDVHPKDVA